MLFILFLVGFYAFISEDAKVPHYEFRQSQLAPTHFQNVPLSTAIEKWISARKDNPQNIYILAGQVEDQGPDVLCFRFYLRWIPYRK
ncbi:MAG: hypothetical protein IPK25_08080 [Saprospiraceae bacterium]|nr:hypothetical protein [Saprospiraceae bacterium]